jgi:hypothetical protein
VSASVRVPLGSLGFRRSVVPPFTTLFSAGSERLFSHPRIRHGPRSSDIIDDEHESMIVIAIEHLDVDARLRHAPRQHAELTRDALFQPLNHDFALREYTNAGCLERPSCCGAVGEKKVCGATATHDPRTAAFDADARAAQRFTHLGERAWAVVEVNSEIDHRGK